MGYRPPKGARPPQLEGKRTGRPKGSATVARVWADARWGYAHRSEEYADDPNQSARLWWTFAKEHPAALERFLRDFGQL
jgi:hypothetical protein